MWKKNMISVLVKKTMSVTIAVASMVGLNAYGNTETTPEKMEVLKEMNGRDINALQISRIGVTTNKLKIRDDVFKSLSQKYQEIKASHNDRVASEELRFMTQYAIYLQKIQESNMDSLKDDKKMFSLASQYNFIYFCQIKNIDNKEDYLLRNKNLKFLESVTLNNELRKNHYIEVVAEVMTLNVDKKPLFFAALIEGYTTCHGGEIPKNEKDGQVLLNKIKQVNSEISEKITNYLK